MDIVDKKIRSRMMSGIRGVNTKPEIQLRSELHKRGYRFRLHEKELPGKPDIILPRYHVVMFVHGCFWHMHECHLFKWPAARKNFWRNKIRSNRIRDEKNTLLLKKMGWRVAIIWECSLRQQSAHSVQTAYDTLEEWIINPASMQITIPETLGP